MGEEQLSLETTVYVRPILVETLPEKLQVEAEGLDQLYALHRADGSPLALVRDRETAFFVARENDLSPVSVH